MEFTNINTILHKVSMPQLREHTHFYIHLKMLTGRAQGGMWQLKKAASEPA